MKFINGYKKGYTLVEILIVVGIISILGSVVTLNVSRQRSIARDTATMLALDGLRGAIHSFRVSSGGDNPPNLESLEDRYIKRLPVGWKGSSGSGDFDYDPLLGVVNLRVTDGSEFDFRNRPYGDY
jgi:prepilin-type N-terminal cleavage/methylation domain-containing protein